MPALVVGCISPDFPYLINLTTVPAPGHTLAGLVPYCLPPSLIVLAVWYRWIERPILSLFRIQASPKPDSAASFILLAAVAVLVGAATHALWDSSSHSAAWLVQQNAWLRYEVANIPLYMWNQNLGGIFGSLGILLWYLCWRTRATDPTPSTKHYFVAVGIFSTLMIGFAFLANAIHGSESTFQYAVRSAVGALTGIGLGAVAYSAWAHFAKESSWS